MAGHTADPRNERKIPVKKPKAAKAVKPAKGAKAAKPAKPAKPAKAPRAPKQSAAVNRLLDPKMKNLFKADVDQWQRLQADVDKMIDRRKKFERENIKAHGFTIKQVQLADKISTPEGEAIVAARMTEEVLVHAYMGMPLGEQLGFMLEPAKPDPLRQARDEGKDDAKHNRPAKPVYAPETDGYKAYMEGYHDVQGDQVRKGISKLDKSKAKTEAAAKPAAKPLRARGAPAPEAVKSAADRAEARAAAKDPGPPRPGLGMTREDHFAGETAGNA
jgi:hypothetical protein